MRRDLWNCVTGNAKFLCRSYREGGGNSAARVRCTWRGLEHFRAYVWSSVVAYNLALFARLKLA